MTCMMCGKNLSIYNNTKKCFHHGNDKALGKSGHAPHFTSGMCGIDAQMTQMKEQGFNTLSYEDIYNDSVFGDNPFTEEEDWLC